MPFFSEEVVDPENEILHGSSSPFLVRRADGPGYTLPFSDRLALKRVYDRAWAILPSKLANIECGHMKPATLLSRLNPLFDTHFSLTADVKACLTEFIDDGCDLGQVYGYLRPWWPDICHEKEFGHLRATMRKQKQEDYDLRSAAVTGNRIINSHIPPRRVWDLYANRVLPYHALKPATDLTGEPCLPLNLLAVSHSWLAPSDRQTVLTTINGKAWHVPIPRGTTLNDIRNELLILGAEYVFLDVLCLRQWDETHPEAESIRKREWRLDIPTIGYIYNENPAMALKPIIVYFNGLGIHFRDGPVDPTDRYNWFNRVWTLQETPQGQVIFGGLKDKLEQISLPVYEQSKVLSAEVSADFLWSLRTLCVGYFELCGHFLGADFASLMPMVAGRAYSNAVDEVACLAYMLGCETLPIYDADIDVEVAWSLLVECLTPRDQLRLLFSDFKPDRRSGSWRPTWEQFKTCKSFKVPNPPYDTVAEHELLKHLDGSSPDLGYGRGFDAYYHSAYVVRECRIRVPQSKANAEECGSVEMRLAGGNKHGTFTVSEWGESIASDNTYVLVSVGALKNWVVAEVVGSRRIEGKRALEVSKVSTLTIPESHSMGSSAQSRSDQFTKRVKGEQLLVVWH